MNHSRIVLRVLTLASLAVVLNGCAYIIPPENNAPRHNTVIGPTRAPQLNKGASRPQSALDPRSNFGGGAGLSSGVAAIPGDAPRFPPVDAATKARAERELALGASPVVPVASAPLAPPVAPTYVADSASGPGFPVGGSVVNAAAPSSLPRQVPIENQPFQVAGNYPVLNAVPPRPPITGPDSARERLSATQADLEREREEAARRQAILARDAAAEPSFAPAPAPSPVSQPPSASPQPALPPRSDLRRPLGNPGDVVASYRAPTAAPAISSPAPRITLPTSAQQSPGFSPPHPLSGQLASVAAPRYPTYPAAVNASPAPVPLPTVGHLVGAAPALAPIVLVPPASLAPNVRPGDFNPLATPPIALPSLASAG